MSQLSFVCLGLSEYGGLFGMVFYFTWRSEQRLAGFLMAVLTSLERLCNFF